MKVFISGKLTPEAMESLTSRVEVIRGGWGYTGKKLTSEELVQQAADCEIMIICYEEINDFVLDRLPKLKMIACTRGGAENIDREALRRHPGVTVTNAPGRNANAVAEVTLGLILSLTRHIARCNHYIMSRDWARVPWDVKGRAAKKTFEGFELEGKTLGLIGYGAIGRRVWQLAAAFGMKLLVYDPFLPDGTDVPLVSLDGLLTQADIVSLHCKVTETTTDMICAETLCKMKPSAILINTGRGALVNEDDLYWALHGRTIAAAALDVLKDEPIKTDSPLLTLDNIVLTPHIGGATCDILYQQSKLVMEDVIGYLEEGKATHVIS